MAARGTPMLTREQRALLSRFIAAGEFRDEAEFEEFARRQALAQLALRELRALRADKPPRKVSRAKVIEETRRIRRQMWREYESSAVR